MYSFVYFSAFIGLLVSAVFLVFMYRNIGRFSGHTLSQWVAKTRKKDDEISADKLNHVRLLLERLAHDVLKHRLLGLHSLFQEMEGEYSPTKKNRKTLKFKSVSSEKDTAFRDEFFRLCGIKSRPEERLWTRYRDAFLEIMHYVGDRLVPPPFDPMFANATKVLFELRRAMVGFVNADNKWALSSKRFYEILSLDFVSVYPATLALAASCRMEIEPADIVQNAIDAVAAQTHRADVKNRIQILDCYAQKLLCDAPSRTLVMCLTRLLDNALAQSEKIAVEAIFSVDEFTGASNILFKVYDMSLQIPDVGNEGMGMRGIRQSLDAFSGGIAFRRESRAPFVKTAIISIPASEYQPVQTTSLKRRVFIVYNLLGLLLIGVFLLCLAYVLGGPPVEFAGKGSDIVEFYAEVGSELEIPLCSGGRNVRAEVIAENAACSAQQCSLAKVLNTLEPCRKSIDAYDCPGVLRWTPQFNDGQRQGRNYELSIHCIADGPPPSEDTRRIRVLVKRPNSAPKVVFAQIINDSKGDIHYIAKSQTTKIDVNDKLRFRVLASDDDADIVVYRLINPDGTIEVSTDGMFNLNPSWSAFATSTFEVEVTDNIAPPVRFRFALEADKLHPIEIERADIVTTNASMRLACEGTQDARICHIPDSYINEMRLLVHFDPLQSRIRPVIDFQASDSQGIYIQHIRKFTGQTDETQLGDQWEIYSRRTMQLFAVAELTNIEKLPAPGTYEFTFRMMSNINTAETANAAAHVLISELSGRMPPAKTLFIFSFSQQNASKYVFVSQHLQVTEYENDADAGAASSGTWVYPVQGESSLPTPMVTNIVCQTPEFAEAFEPAQVKSLKNAWRIDFKLKRGCIAGLTNALSAKQRLCNAHVRFGENDDIDKEIWLMLESRDCAPRVETLTLANASPLERADSETQHNYVYRFKIVDPDGDLPKNQIHLSGTKPNALKFEQENHQLGDTYIGTFELNIDCSQRASDPIVLSATDASGRTTNKTIVLPQACLAPARTQSGEQFFLVDEGSLLKIPIIHDEDVSLSLNSRFGSLDNGTFSWLASCSYGAGPHIVEITTPDNRNAPLHLEIKLRCHPRYAVSIDDTPAIPSAPVSIAPNASRRIEITGLDLSEFEFIPQSSALLPNLRLVESSKGDDAYFVDVSCAQPNEQPETIKIQILPKDVSQYLQTAPVAIDFTCSP